ncbi:phosphoribosylamine--glycine ligase [Cloacibacterium sp.]|uniref:phosphoribosylamine--glycine ligase n=1 Tax=Cloacibacterium sp. TaxID=1913682 RepID=UPI0039E2D7E1
MKVLIIGNGGRESAVAKKLAEDKRISKLYFAKGNATTELLGENLPFDSVSELRDFAIKEQIDFTFVGPELPLVKGIVDEFQKHDLKIFGPTKRAADLEGSKAFSKKFMVENGVRTAKAEIFDSYVLAKEYVQTQKYPLVVKASGLAAGKGVVICEDVEQAEATLRQFMIDKIFGDAGIKVVIEQFLKGFEASVIAFWNGKQAFSCVSAKDYKKIGNGDTGLNTGGMGTVAPSPEFTAEHFADFEKNILEPTVKGIKESNLNFVGFIFFGVLVENNECYLLEYNMRLGDPETQVIMALLESNLLDVLTDCLEGKEINLSFADKKAVCLVMTSGGYPGNYETGYEITGIDKVKDSEVLFAGAEIEHGKIVTTGGRVLNIVATGDTYQEARKKVYQDALSVRFDYAYYREDIGNF